MSSAAPPPGAPLSKRQVESLLVTLDATQALDDATATAELVGALGPALAIVLGVPAATPWAELVARATRRAGWPAHRAALLAAAATSTATRASLEDLVVEPNELRTLARA